MSLLGRSPEEGNDTPLQYSCLEMFLKILLKVKSMWKKKYAFFMTSYFYLREIP